MPVVAVADFVAVAAGLAVAADGAAGLAAVWAVAARVLAAISRINAFVFIVFGGSNWFAFFLSFYSSGTGPDRKFDFGRSLRT